MESYSEDHRQYGEKIYTKKQRFRTVFGRNYQKRYILVQNRSIFAQNYILYFINKMNLVFY